MPQLKEIMSTRTVLDIQTIQSVLSCLQNMSESAVYSISSAILDKLLQEVLTIGKSLSEDDLPMVDKFLMAVIINVVSKSPRLDDNQALTIFRIILNMPTNDDTDFDQRDAAIEEVVRTKGVVATLASFQGIYNEVKFNLSVGYCS